MATTGNLSALLGGSGIKPTGLINGVSGLSINNTVFDNTALTANAGFIKIVSPSVVAGVLTTILSVSGKGVISFLAAQNVEVTNRAHRLKVTLDGVVIFDATSIVSSSSSRILNVIGQVSSPASGSSFIGLEPLCFESSLLIEYASSLTESAKSNIGYRYIPR